MIPFQDLKKTNSHLSDRYVDAARRVIESGRYINGSEVASFEKELASATGSRFCIAVSTGLDALRLILRGYMALGRLRDGDEVIVPANTFIATFLAVTDCGLTAMAADVEEGSYCLDFNKLPLSPLTRAVIPVHLFGRPCWSEESVSRLRSRGILIIEDNAQALGASLHGRKTGSLGDASAISFYPAKNIGAFGDAGAVLTDDASLSETVRMLANYGSSEKYRHELCGFNCRMDELQAAMLRVKLSDLPLITERRNHSAALYSALISNPHVSLPAQPEEGSVHAWHQYVIAHPRRNELREFLLSHGVGTEIHYPVACHRQPCYQSHHLLKTAPGGLPVAENLAERILSLPIADISDDEIRTMADLINRFS